MFHIGICEDDLIQQNHLEKCIMAWSDKRGHKIRMHKFISAEQFLFEYEDVSDFELLILDIQLKHMTGMELAKEIRKKNSYVKIVFLTGVTDYAIEGYEVGAVRYLLKPLKTDCILESEEKLPIAKSCYDELNKRFSAFYKYVGVFGFEHPYSKC